MGVAHQMKLALISGDGLPVSGLLTVFRNVVQIGMDDGLLELPIPADLGYSWRPDKPGFFPCGSPTHEYPSWLDVTDTVPWSSESKEIAESLTEIRCDVARAETLSPVARDALWQRMNSIADCYAKWFSFWFEEHAVDWVLALNMTLSDASPVTIGLHRAAAARWGCDRKGGVVFWDHDLFASYSVYDAGLRMYPTRPNEFTPLPGTHPCHRWVVVSDELAEEVAAYPTPLRPVVAPNVLPQLRDSKLQSCHREFLAQNDLDPTRPMVLAPVRVFRVKGIEISISLLASVRSASLRRGGPVPYLLVFGSLEEDPEYTLKVLSAVEHESVHDDVRFLDGVPLTSYRDSSGRWHLDEVDLLRIATATGGGVFFTPNRFDVESVGLGAALAAVAGIPCATTDYNAFGAVYGSDLGRINVSLDGGLNEAGEEFAEWIIAQRRGDRWAQDILDANRLQVLRRFSEGPWRMLLREMHDAVCLHELLSNDRLPKVP